MAEGRGGLGARLARHLARLGARRKRKGKRTPEEARSQDRPWGGQSCPDLAQGQGSTSNVSLKAQVQSLSEWDIQAGSCGSWLWKRRHSSGGPAEPLGRLQRPAVGSASDLARYASMGPESLALAVTSAEPAAAKCPSCLVPAPGHLEQRSPACACLQPLYTALKFPLRPEPLSNLGDMLPRPASSPRAEGAKGETASPGPALSEPAQSLHERPCARRTRYHITVTMRGRGQAPGEESEEPKPAQPAPHPCGPEESRGWQEPPQGLRPITRCLTDPPQEPRLRAPHLHQRSAAQRQELQAGWPPGSPHRRELDHSGPRTPQDRLPGPNMEEASGPLAQDKARVSPALKTQGKLNTRPGKMILFSEPGCQGSSRDVWEDTADASGWACVASIRVVRGCWVLYEEPEFRGQKLVLPEGDVELGAPGPAWSTQGIGSLRRVVRDYITPEISLYSEEGLKGQQVKLTEALEDPQRLERPLQVASATVSAGLWLLYPKPFFENTPCILEPGEYPTSEAWGASDPSVGSLKPMRLGCPSVEKPGEPKAVVYEAPDFQGQSWEVSRDIYNLQQPEDSQSPHLASVGSLRVLGGCWVGYEKEGFRGHQYLLEEGEYADWSHWGGYNEALTSLRVIRTDFGDPALVLFEAMDFEGHGVEVSEALRDVELAGHGPRTQAIHVLSGVWVAYQEVGFSGEQYVLEKGVYRNCDDWGAGNSALASLQPVLQVGEHNLHFVSKIQLFSGPDFLGDHISFEDDQTSLPSSFQPQSCRVLGGSWILFDEKNFEGEQHILSEGEFPTLTAMGCLASTVLGSLRRVPLHFSEPSIFLYGLECFEGKEIELSREVRSLQAEGFNNHVLSVRIKGGVWVLCEHSDFRGRQWLVGSCEITNWLTYSGTQRVGSLYPIKQRRAYFRLWNEALGGFLAVPDHVEDMKAGRVVVSEPRAGGSCIWYHEDGLLKNQVAPTMSLQVIGPPSTGSKVVLWAESRLPRQTWSIDESGHICSQMFEGRILDVKGGQGYDRDHAVLWELAKDRASQIWAVRVL
ncbi:beta/gamma crystallin domain-containing protein 2 isoform X3 [Vicugna pacos]|uniref:Beta/gamma crystallin domain-containing protein 2 isoform X3 n=1 Tax=Vicugna pacos TaxID=30538 RepID=A0ABM5EDC8_VICPA